MTEQKKKTIITSGIAVLAMILAYCFRIVGRGSFYPMLFSYLRSFIYIGLFAAWGLSVRQRIVQKQVCRFMTVTAHHMDGSPFGKVFYILAAGCRPLPVVSVLSAHAVCAYAGAADCHVIGKAGRIQISQGNVDSVDHLRRIASARAHK